MTVSESISAIHPAAPKSLAEAGLNTDLMQSLLLKTLHFGGELAGAEVAKKIGLAFSVIEPTIEFLKQQRLVEIAGGSVFGGASYRYRLTDGGRSRALQAIEQSHYVGIAPVPFDDYRRYMLEFKKAAPLNASRANVRTAFSHLVVTEKIIDAVGPAVNSGHSMFVYGSPGNGKTMIAQGIRQLLEGYIAIPHAISVESHIIRLFDPVNHEQVPFEDEETGSLARGVEYDRRWARCRRPLVMVGGELTMQDLELRYSANSGYYRAPVQLIANGGILVIDDFGRQQCSPRDLLNRWIVPLESRIDFLTLQSGQSIEMPFMVLLVFATNLKPTELADEAFLRRIQYKIFAESPSLEDFARIFQNYCTAKAIPFDRHVVDDMLESFYRPNKIPMRGCHPRDLINQALALANYRGEPAQLTPELMTAACRNYFVSDQDAAASLG